MLANFFDRAVTSAAAVLEGFEATAFTQRLEAQLIDLVYDDRADRSQEGRACLDMAIRLLARLYPRISISPVGRARKGLRRELAGLARSINPRIEIVEEGAPTVRLVVGRTSVSGDLVVYAGSDRWIAVVSTGGPVGCGDSANPLGAGAAACLGAANVFRAVFGQQLPGGGALDRDARVSLFDFTTGANATGPELPPVVDLGATHLIGIGAIGNAAVWGLSRFPGLEGVIDLVDCETVELSNLQRYILATQDDALQARPKTEVARRHFGVSNAMEVRPWQTSLSGFLAARGNWRLGRAAAALDTARDRILLQGALPAKIHNSWTQAADLGVSRHGDPAGPGACLACLYMPVGEEPHHDEQVAQAVGLPEPMYRMGIRQLLHTGQPVGMEFLELVGERLGIALEKLEPYAGEPLSRFYSHGVCGGALIQVTPDASTQAPLAFQSAMAGIMLAADIVADASGSRPKALPTKTTLDLLRPLATILSSPVGKVPPDAPARCLCGDDDFLSVYTAKYPHAAPAADIDMQSGGETCIYGQLP